MMGCARGKFWYCVCCCTLVQALDPSLHRLQQNEHITHISDARYFSLYIAFCSWDQCRRTTRCQWNWYLKLCQKVVRRCIRVESLWRCLSEHSISRCSADSEIIGTPTWDWSKMHTILNKWINSKVSFRILYIETRSKRCRRLGNETGMLCAWFILFAPRRETSSSSQHMMPCRFRASRQKSWGSDDERGRYGIGIREYSGTCDLQGQNWAKFKILFRWFQTIAECHFHLYGFSHFAKCNCCKKSSLKIRFLEFRSHEEQICCYQLL